MKQLKKIPVGSILIIGIFIIHLSSCSNDNELIQQKDEMVATPFGLIEKSKVFLVEDGYATRIENNRLLMVKLSSGKIIQDLGILSVTQDNPLARIKGGNDVPSSVNDVIVATDPTIGSYTNFSADITVPVAPAQNTETLFIGTRMLVQTPNQCLLEPVLQYGLSAAGGGNYWSAAAWQLLNGIVTHTTLQTNISPGTVLGAKLQYQTNAYVAYFSGGSSITYLTPLTTSNLSFFLGGAPSTTCEYPTQFAVAAKGIDIHSGTTYPTVAWNASGSSSHGEHFRVINTASPSGEVDICFYGNPSGLWYPSSGSYPVSLSWTGPFGAMNYDVSYTVYPPAGSPVNGIGTSTTTSYTFPFALHQYSGGNLISKVRAHFGGTVVSDWSSPYNTVIQ